jgi:DNA-binding transcriptional LysR family regulator
MTLDQLSYFYEAARFQHIGKAAKASSISPSAISSAIAALEDELDTALFDRVGKSIILTEGGKRLKKEAEAILEQVKGVKTRVTNQSQALSGQYRLGASHFLAAYLLTPAWNKLQEANTGLVGEVCSQSTVNVVSDVIAGAIDFGICFSPFKHPDLHQEQIYSGQLQLAFRVKHSLASLKLDKQTAKALSDFPAVVHKANAGVDICEHHPIFEEFGIEPKTSFLFDSDACAVEKLSHSDHWALLPDIVIRHYSTQIKSMGLPKSWNAPYNITMIVRRDRAKNLVFLKLKDLLREVLM